MGSFIAACGLLTSCGGQSLECKGSVVAQHGLSCPAVCEILVPRPELEPASPALEGGFLTTGQPGKSQQFYYYYFTATTTVTTIISYLDFTIAIPISPIPHG